MGRALEFRLSVETWHASEILKEIKHKEQNETKQKQKISERKHFGRGQILSSHRLPKPPGLVTKDRLQLQTTLRPGSGAVRPRGRGPHHRGRM